MRRFLSLLLLTLPLFATDHMWVRDYAKGVGCRITGVTTASPAVFTCAADAGFSMSIFSNGQTIVVYDVLGTLNVNGIRIMQNISGNTFTITDISGTAINTSNTFIPATALSTTTSNFDWGYADPVVLMALSDHPRTWGASGPSGGLAAAVVDPSGRANTSGPNYGALVNSYNTTVGTYTATPNNSNLAPFFSAVLKWWADSKPGSGALHDYALWLPANVGASTVPGWSDGMACGRTFNCGTTQPTGDTDYFSLYSQNMIGVYDWTYGQYSGAVQQDWVNYFLNDLGEAKGGLGRHNAITSDCTLLAASGTQIWTGDPLCGSITLLKHHPASQFANSANYDTNQVPDTSNQGLTKSVGYFGIGVGLCGSDVAGDAVADRGCRLGTMAEAYLWDHMYSQIVGQWGGMSECDDFYHYARCGWIFNYLNATLTNAIVGFPSVAQPIIDSNALLPIYTTIPYSPYSGDNIATGMYWGQGQGYGGDFNNDGGLTAVIGTMFTSPTYAPKISYWMQNITQWWSAVHWGTGGAAENYTHFYYLYADPTVTPTNVNTLSTQRLFSSTQSVSDCTRLNLYCNQYQWPVNSFVSKTGWGANDTMVFGMNFTITGDGHTGPYPGGRDTITNGAVRIFRKQGLLGGNDTGTVSGSGDNFSFSTPGENTIVLGGTYANYPANANPIPPFNVGANLTRWAGTVPTGSASGTYAYAMFDLTNQWAPQANLSPATTITAIHKHVSHRKPSGSQDYVIVHVDGVFTNPIQLQEYILPRLQYDQAATLYSPGLTASLASKTVTVADSASGAQGNFAFFDLAGSTSVYFDDENHSDVDCHYAQSTAPLIGGISPSCRFVIGSSTDGATSGATTTSEWVDVYQPCASYACTMPTITKPSCSGTGGSCGALQIADPTTPIVHIMPRQNTLLTGVTLTTTHAGTGDYLIESMTPGNYTVTKNGTPVAASPVTVSANDNTLAFTSASGAIVVTAGSPTCTITTSTLPAGTVGTPYSQTLATANCTAPITWTVSTGSLPTGLSLGSSTGSISGTPTIAGSSAFTVQAVDSVPTTTTQPLSLTINAAPATNGQSFKGNINVKGNIVVINH